MLRLGIIEPCGAVESYVPMLGVKKDPDNPKSAVRPLVDHSRYLNNICAPLGYPGMETAARRHSLCAGDRQSKLDALSGFHNVRIRERWRDYTAFSFNGLLYRYAALPQGASFSPALFTGIMSTIFADLIKAGSLSLYMDDQLARASGHRAHLELLHTIFSRLCAHGITLSRKKCMFDSPMVPFLGHMSSVADTSLSEDRVRALQAWRRPASVKELRSLLGAFGFVRDFIPRFAILVQPLNQLLVGLAKGARLPPWTAREDKALDDLKAAVGNAVHLANVTESGLYELYPDAAEAGAGAVLLQRQLDGTRTLVGLFSAAFTPAQGRASAYRRELLGLCMALKHFATFLIGRHFVVHTDNEGLTRLHSASLADRDSHEVRLILYARCEYSFTIRHIPGELNSVADLCSRQPSDINGDDIEAAVSAHADQTLQRLDMRGPGQAPIPVFVGSVLMDPARRGMMLSADGEPPADARVLELGRRLDAELFPLSVPGVVATEGNTDADQLFLGTVFLSAADWARFQQEDADIVAMRQLSATDKKAARFVMRQGVLCNHNRSGIPRVVVPRRLRHRLLELLHNPGHVLGHTLLQMLAQRRLWWPEMREEVLNYGSECASCAVERHQTTLPVRGTFETLGVPKRPMVMLSIDCAGPFEDSKGVKSWFLAIKDVFSSYAWCFRLLRHTAEAVAEHVRAVFEQFSAPSFLKSDSGSEMKGEAMQRVLRLYNVRHILSTPGSPQSNGVAEILVKALKIKLRGVLSAEEGEWQQHINHVLEVYNNEPVAGTTLTRFAAFFGRERYGRLGLLPTEEILPRLVNEMQSQRLWLAWRRRQEDAMEQRMRSYHRTVFRKQHFELKNGDLCLLKRVHTGPNRSLLSLFTGPYRCVERRSGSAVLEDESGLCVTVPVERIKVIQPCDDPLFASQLEEAMYKESETWAVVWSPLTFDSPRESGSSADPVSDSQPQQPLERRGKGSGKRATTAQVPVVADVSWLDSDTIAGMFANVRAVATMDSMQLRKGMLIPVAVGPCVQLVFSFDGKQEAIWLRLDDKTPTGEALAATVPLVPERLRQQVKDHVVTARATRMRTCKSRTWRSFSSRLLSDSRSSRLRRARTTQRTPPCQLGRA
eukprot:c19987_g1_i1.p1 GENE.c19987_g1_i1~~c19987_g1_i1.p1  ORF type:complete len:1116 (+),score=135.87 c19987_g1_i1:2797-6144(+)